MVYSLKINLEIIYLLGSRWELDTGLSGIRVVGNDDSRVSGGLGEFSAVSVFHLDAAAGSSFGHVSDWENVSDVESGLFTTIDSLARGGTLSSNEKLLVLSKYLSFKHSLTLSDQSNIKLAHSFQPICGFFER